MPQFTLLLDRSGSIATIDASLQDGAQELIAELEDDTFVTIVPFASTVHEHMTVDKHAASDLLRQVATPRGTTCLWDAIAQTVSAQLQDAADDGPRTIAIVTDGLDTSSQEHDARSAHDLISDAKEAGFHIFFVGANIDATQVAGQIGVASGQALNFAPNTEGARNAMRSLSAAVRRSSSVERGVSADFLEVERTESMA
jgi:hypothetical protein